MSENKFCRIPNFCRPIKSKFQARNLSENPRSSYRHNQELTNLLISTKNTETRSIVPYSISHLFCLEMLSHSQIWILNNENQYQIPIRKSQRPSPRFTRWRIRQSAFGFTWKSSILSSKSFAGNRRSQSLYLSSVLIKKCCLLRNKWTSDKRKRRRNEWTQEHCDLPIFQKRGWEIMSCCCVLTGFTQGSRTEAAGIFRCSRDYAGNISNLR